jgi:dTDP-4-dehydrorhamnose 3,5-epimerase
MRTELLHDVAKPLMLEGLTWTPKKVMADDRGSVKLMLKEGEFDFPIGEIYFSTINPGVVKGWKLHKVMWQRYVVPVGDVKFVFVDQRPHSSTFGKTCEFESGLENYGLITVPPGLWYSFKCQSIIPAVIANAASIPRQAGESDSMELTMFEYYRW